MTPHAESAIPKAYTGPFNPFDSPPLTYCRRIGNGKFGMKPIMTHPWFKGLDWVKLEKEEMNSPFVPTIKGEADVTNFDEVDSEKHLEQKIVTEDKML